MTSTLRRWLTGRAPADLEEILRHRSEVLYQPLPRDLGEVADRLHYPHNIQNALVALPQPCLEVLETLLVFGRPGLSRAELAALLHVEADDPALLAALGICEMWAIAWEFDDRIHVPGALRSILARPLDLGPGAADLLTPRTVDELRRRAGTLGLTSGNRKTDIIAAFAEFYADGEAVRRFVAMAPDHERAAVTQAAWRDPMLKREAVFMYPSRTDPEFEWLIAHSLVIVDWQSLVVPREVAIALRGPDWHPRLTGRADLGIPVHSGVEAVDRSAGAAANTALESVTLLVDACGATPITVLKAGNIGVREMRRLAKATGLDAGAIEMYLAVARGAGLIGPDDGEIVPTTAYDTWGALPAPDRLVSLLRAWHRLSSLFPDGGQISRLLLRPDVLARSADWPDGSGFAGLADLVRDLEWHRPLTMSRLPPGNEEVAAIWGEAQLLGLAAGSAISSLGRALVADDGTDALAAVAAKFVHPPSDEAIFQADLTVIVPGSPSPEITALLDATADRESRGAATTWRISATSVRRALDGGRGAGDLLDGLRAIAAGSNLPQTLEYLITDTARRHGTIRVRALACVVRADDAALIHEIAATKSLAKLGLSVLSPTLLASQSTPDETLAALRAAGYAPMGEHPDGTTRIERTTRRRTPQPTDATVRELRPPVIPPQYRGGPAGRLDLSEYASDLLTTAIGDPMAPLRSVSRAANPSSTAFVEVGSPTRQAVSAYAGHLPEDQQEILAAAIDEEQPIWIVYTSTSGARTERVIEPVELDGRLLTAWCNLRDDERNFSLDRIEAVESAD